MLFFLLFHAQLNSKARKHSTNTHITPYGFAPDSKCTIYTFGHVVVTREVKYLERYDCIAPIDRPEGPAGPLRQRSNGDAASSRGSYPNSNGSGSGSISRPRFSPGDNDENKHDAANDHVTGKRGTLFFEKYIFRHVHRAVSLVHRFELGVRIGVELSTSFSPSR